MASLLPVPAPLAGAIRGAGSVFNKTLHDYLVNARADVLEVMACSTDHATLLRAQGFAQALELLSKQLPQIKGS